MKEIKYHPAVDLKKRQVFPGMFAKLDDDIRSLVEAVREKKCGGITTPLVYNLTEWLLSNTLKQLGYVIRFRKRIIPLLTKLSESETVTGKNFVQKFYGPARSIVDEIGKEEGKSLKTDHRIQTVERIDYYIQVKGKQRSLPPPTAEQVQQITEGAKKMQLADICSLARKSYMAEEKKFLTSFCVKILGELGLTTDQVSGTHVYSSSTGEKHRVQRQLVKAVMSQLRLRIVHEAQERGLIKIGSPLPFSSKIRTLVRISYTGMLIVPQGEGSMKTTHVDPIYYPLLKAIEDHEATAVSCHS